MARRSIGVINMSTSRDEVEAEEGDPEAEEANEVAKAPERAMTAAVAAGPEEDEHLLTRAALGWTHHWGPGQAHASCMQPAPARFAVLLLEHGAAYLLAIVSFRRHFPSPKTIGSRTSYLCCLQPCC